MQSPFSLKNLQSFFEKVTVWFESQNCDILSKLSLRHFTKITSSRMGNPSSWSVPLPMIWADTPSTNKTLTPEKFVLFESLESSPIMCLEQPESKYHQVVACSALKALITMLHFSWGNKPSFLTQIALVFNLRLLDKTCELLSFL